MIGSIQEETLRRRRKLSSLREAGLSKTELAASMRRVHPVGIMTVRTMEESLSSDSCVDPKSKNFKLRRRKLMRKLGNGLPENGNSPSTSSTASSIDCSSSGLTKSVTFSAVSIREFPLIPGDNPTAPRGPPLSFGWDFDVENSFDFYEYEAAKGTRRTPNELIIPPQIRSSLLRKNGHDWKTIQAAIKAANISRRQRMGSLERIHADKFDEKMEKISRGVKKMFEKRGKKKTLQNENKVSFDANHLQESSSTKSTARVENDDIDISLSNSTKKYDLELAPEEIENGDLSTPNEAFGKYKHRPMTSEVNPSLDSSLRHRTSEPNTLQVPSAIISSQPVVIPLSLKIVRKDNISDALLQTVTPGTGVDDSNRSKLSNDSSNTEPTVPLIESERTTFNEDPRLLSCFPIAEEVAGNLIHRSGHAAFKVERNESFWDGEHCTSAYRSDDEQNICCGAAFSKLSVPMAAAIKYGLKGRP